MWRPSGGCSRPTRAPASSCSPWPRTSTGSLSRWRGARGYLHKDASRAELRATVTQALADPTWRLAPRRLRSAEMGAAPTLTAREIQVLEGMSHGRSNAEIGRELFLSEDTVKTHARRLFKKLGASDRAHAVALGFRWGLVR